MMIEIVPGISVDSERVFGKPVIAEILIARQRMLPRQVLPRQFYLITRRCVQRQFLLHPDLATNNAFLSWPPSSRA